MEETAPSESPAPFVATRGNRIKELSITHESLMDWLILNPEKSLRDCATVFGYTQAWISSIVNSGAFQARLAEKQKEITSAVALDLPRRLQTVAHIAIDNLTRELEKNGDAALALKALDSAMSAMKPSGGVNLNIHAPTNNLQQVFATKEDLAQARLAMKAAGAATSEALRGTEMNTVAVDEVQVLEAPANDKD